LNAIIPLLTQYGYWILFPLAAIEGPLVCLVVGFLIYLGVFQFIPAYLILILGDLIPDVTYYYIGRFGNKKKLIEKYGSRLSIISNNFGLVEKLWRDHGKKTMFLSKLAYGLSTPFLISAGLVNMPLKRFVAYALPVTLLQYAIILSLGYFLGRCYEVATGYIQGAGFVIAGLLILFIVGYVFFLKYARKQIIKMEKDEL